MTMIRSSLTILTQLGRPRLGEKEAEDFVPFLFIDVGDRPEKLRQISLVKGWRIHRFHSG